MNWITLSCCLALTTFCSGCGSFIEGTSGMTRSVLITSTPPHAVIKLNDIPKGKTPTSVIFNPIEIRSGVVTVSLDGYHTETIDLRKGIDLKSAGNLLIGGALGLGVDYLTGATLEEFKYLHIDLHPISNELPIPN